MFVLNEIVTNGMNYNILSIIPLISILCGVFVIVTKNPIVSVLFLIGLFISMAGYLMTLGMNFIGLSYILVYVGAVSILFLFILMLINVRISELVTENNNSVPLAIIIIALISVNQFSPGVTSMPAMMTRVTNLQVERHVDKGIDFVSYNSFDNVLTAISPC
jgi:NADH-ubiquinone oxidoreductase chain 6